MVGVSFEVAAADITITTLQNQDGKRRRQLVNASETLGLISAFDKTVRNHLAESEDFDPTQVNPTTGHTYIQTAMLLHDRAAKVFSAPINNPTTFLDRINRLILDMYQRKMDLNERKFPTVSSKYGYVHLRAKKETPTLIRQVHVDGGPDVEVGEVGNVKIFVAASKESFTLHNQESGHGQDAAGALELSDAQGKVTGYQLIQTDGVGQAYRSEGLARILVRYLIQAPGRRQLSLDKFAQQYHELLLHDTFKDVPPLVKQALKDTLKKTGSASTVNKVVVGVDGRVAGALRGDGLLGVVRQNGDIELYEFGSHKDVVQTQPDGETKTLSIEDITDGKGITLSKGDHLLLSSDGLGHGTGKFRRILELFTRGLSDKELEAEIIKIFAESEIVDDDKSLVVYSA